MSTAIRWPVCSVPKCGHFKSHTDKGTAEEYARANQRRYTTPEGNAVCVCHEFIGEMPFDRLPKVLFLCNQSWED